MQPQVDRVLISLTYPFPSCSNGGGNPFVISCSGCQVQLANSKTREAFWSSKPISALIHLARWQLGWGRTAANGRESPATLILEEWLGLACQVSSPMEISLAKPQWKATSRHPLLFSFFHFKSWTSVSFLICLVLFLHSLVSTFQIFRNSSFNTTCELVLFLKELVISQSWKNCSSLKIGYLGLFLVHLGGYLASPPFILVSVVYLVPSLIKLRAYKSCIGLTFMETCSRAAYQGVLAVCKLWENLTSLVIS